MPLREAMHHSLVGQLAFLAVNLEQDLGGNHLIKNIKALTWGSVYFNGDAADQWRGKGVALLRAALAEQVLADGMHFERSPSYHAQVFADLLECRAALGHDPCAGDLDATLHRMAQVVADLAHPDGGPALFNDAGMTMCYAPQSCLDAYSRMFGRHPKPRAVFAYPDAGFFGCRIGTDAFIADCGPIGADSLPAHAHGDVLSCEWSVAGQRIFVDQGVFEYVAGPKRSAARSTAHHNTLSVEGHDQAEFFSDFRVARRPRVQVRSFAPREDGFSLVGLHDGYRHLRGAPRHVRHFDVTQDVVTLEDTIEGHFNGDARIAFLLHPSVNATVPATTPCTVILKTNMIEIHGHASAAIRIEPAVWWPDMGIEHRTQRLFIELPPTVTQMTTRWSVMRRTA
jgi:uncharacterized heparinase superfamily protein